MSRREEAAQRHAEAIAKVDVLVAEAAELKRIIDAASARLSFIQSWGNAGELVQARAAVARVKSILDDCDRPIVRVAYGTGGTWRECVVVANGRKLARVRMIGESAIDTIKRGGWVVVHPDDHHMIACLSKRDGEA